MGQEEGLFCFEKSRATTKAWRRKPCRGDRGFLDGCMHACCLWISKIECISPSEINSVIKAMRGCDMDMVNIYISDLCE